ncbi:hypothetical protein [Streptomyces sp. NPDC055036]
MQARSIVRETVKPEYTRYTPTNGKKPDGADFGVDGWLFALPGETLGGVQFPQAMYAAFQVSERGTLFWRVREVMGERRQVGSGSTTRKGALALAVNTVAQQREKAAAPITRVQGTRAHGAAWRLASEGGKRSQVSATMGWSGCVRADSPPCRPSRKSGWRTRSPVGAPCCVS